MEVTRKTLASDNAAPVHPEIMEAIVSANLGHAIAYGDDPWTRSACKALAGQFGTECTVAFVYNGTGANVVGVQTALSSFNSVVCSDMSHVAVDECGAIEKLTGSKTDEVRSVDGRIDVAAIEKRLEVLGVEHHSQPRVVSVTQATEVGTVYSPEQIREIADLCHERGLYLHMDGARISNAAVSLGTDLAGTTIDCGVDILSLGGTKNGAMFGEAVVVFDSELVAALPFIRKQSTQLASKMRYVAVQFERLFATDLWRRNAEHANTMARRLERELSTREGVEIVYPVEANGVFARMPQRVIDAAREEVFFYSWDAGDRVVRLMCSWDTEDEEVDRLLAAIDRAL
jgi:threonine aldolase